MATWLTGVVTDEETGRPLPGVVVRVEVNGWPRAWTETDDVGRYTFDDWPALHPRTASGAMAIVDGLVVAVRAMHPQYGSSARWFQPACGSSFEVASSDCPQHLGFRLRPIDALQQEGATTCTLEGRVTVNGEPGSRAEVVFENGEVEAVADSEGRFRAAGVAPGIRTLWVRRLAAFPHERVVWVACEDPNAAIRLGFQLLERGLN
jgi:hypothetical protein